MKMTVRLFAFSVFALALANNHDQTQIERYVDRIKPIHLERPGKQPTTIIEAPSEFKFPRRKWQESSIDRKDTESLKSYWTDFIHDQKRPATIIEAPSEFEFPRGKWQESSIDRKDTESLKNYLTDIIHDPNGHPKCFGPSCQEVYNENEGLPEENQDFSVDSLEKVVDFREISKEKLAAISALAAKLKKNKYKPEQYLSIENTEPENDRKVITSWNRVKVKNHKHPFDDKDGWVTLEPIAWSTSKVSKWKPNKKLKPRPSWNNDEERFPTDDIISQHNYNHNTQNKRPSPPGPTYINNQLHIASSDYEDEMPSRPSWNKVHNPQNSYNYQSWSPDDGRRPHNPDCDSDEHYHADGNVYFGIPDSVVTDNRPSRFPNEYEALHQAAQKRPMKRPTQVVYAGSPDLDSDGPYGDGQWVLLSTTRGYKKKKRQRALDLSSKNHNSMDGPEFDSTFTSHHSVGLTVLPIDDAHTNMTTSHGGILEVEKSFKTVEESKRDMDKKNDLETSASQNKPTVNRIIRKFVSNGKPDSSTLLAAVGAGMVPATMAMVVPMMLGKKRRRRDITQENIDRVLYKYE